MTFAFSAPAAGEPGGDLPRSFKDRAALTASLRALFPQLEGDPSPIRGGRRQAERLLAAMDPVLYGSTRNHLDGAVTRLSPYIRHGVLTLAEVRQAVFAQLRQAGLDRKEAHHQGGKLINELGWRDYWQRLWRRLGDRIWDDIEPLKTGHPPDVYADQLPEDIASGRTGLACMDAFAQDLARVGWLHNHARMWLASYVVHWRLVRWQAGAGWFLRHLLDGDPASNNLSWQWVASSFSAKPYIFNRANLERFSGGRYCRGCERARAGGASRPGGCPFEASYEELQQRLFPGQGTEHPGRANAGQQSPSKVPALNDTSASSSEFDATSRHGSQPPQSPVLWIQDEALGPANPCLRHHSGRPAVFVFDTEWIGGRSSCTAGAAGPPQPLSLKRLVFLYECLLELPVTIRRGDGAAEVVAFARRHGADAVVTSAAVDPHFERQGGRIAAEFPVQQEVPEPFVTLPDPAGQSLDLGRFSRYWRRAEARVWSLW